jgi:hypothetical protein
LKTESKSTSFEIVRLSRFLKFAGKIFIVYLHLNFVPWCNGSTVDFGSACLGSNPGGTANEDPQTMRVFCFIKAGYPAL